MRSVPSDATSRWTAASQPTCSSPAPRCCAEMCWWVPLCKYFSYNVETKQCWWGRTLLTRASSLLHRQPRARHTPNPSLLHASVCSLDPSVLDAQGATIHGASRRWEHTGSEECEEGWEEATPEVPVSEKHLHGRAPF